MNWNPFKKKEISDLDIIKTLGTNIFIRNGVGYGFISTPELYNNKHLEIGFGRTTSQYGDWGGGADRASTSVLKIVIDKDYNIISKRVWSYSTIKSGEIAAKAEKLIPRLKEKLIIKTPTLKIIIDDLLAVLPCKKHIGLDADLADTHHALSMCFYFINENSTYSHLPNANEISNG